MCTESVSTKKNEKQVIILKSDDFVFSEKWKRYVKYIEDKNIKACLGVVSKELKNDSLCEWIKSLVTIPNFEFWNHGLTHDCGEDQSEFRNTSYEYQLAHLQQSQQLFKDNFGVTLRAFNVPCMESDKNTIRALADIDDIKIWFYGRNGASQLCLARNGNIEFPYGHPDYNKFVEKYNEDRLEQYDHLLLQLHPGFWDEKRWNEFVKIMDYLFQEEVVFMTASEYYRSITAMIEVTGNEDSGPGSLRAAIDQANNDNLENADITLPAGVYYLSGKSGEDGNVEGDLDIASDLTIMGAGADVTIIDGSGSDRVFHIHSGRVKISGVTIRNGRASSGGGIRVDGGTATVRNCIITGNTIFGEANQGEKGGGGIYAQNAKITISGCTISNNTGNSAADMKGGGIYINHLTNITGHVDTRNCLIEGNIANTHPLGKGWGGGLYLTGIGNANLERNRFVENASSTNGNGYGGVIFAKEGTAVTMKNNLLANNKTSRGAIYLQSIACTMINNTLADNNREKTGSQDEGGEGLYLEGNVTLDLVNNVIAGHSKGIYNNGAGTVNADTNLFYNDSEPLIGVNALLRDSLLDSEFKPMENSPVVDAGKTIDTLSNDLAGVSRPLGNGYDIGCYEFVPPPEPLIFLDRDSFNFARSGTHITGSQVLRIDNDGTGTLNWTAEPNQPWIQVNPAVGVGAGSAIISIDYTGLPPGSYSGTISVSADGALNSPQMVNVNVTVYKPGVTGHPFGDFSSPENGTADVSGSIAITGWALDAIQVEKVEIYCEHEGVRIYVGDAVFVEGARPDAERAYPGYPFNYRAGWGYMMLTHFLPQKGNGTYTIYAEAIGSGGNRFTLGAKTISCNNADAVKPFGNIDIPVQGGAAIGKSFKNWGWALTPPPNHIPTDGSTIIVWVNGVNVGHPTYNLYRTDIAGLFPGYLNSEGAVAFFSLDTTVYKNGIHSIQWTAEDSAGNKDGIGSRYFSIQNTEGLNAYSVNSNDKQISINPRELKDLPIDRHTPLWIKKGYREDVQPHKIYPGDNGIIHIKIKELERIQIRLPGESSDVYGRLLVGDRPRPLPIGSTLDARVGTFCWQPGPGFLGLYRLNFIVKRQDGKMSRLDIIVEITMKGKPANPHFF